MMYAIYYSGILSVSPCSFLKQMLMATNHQLRIAKEARNLLVQ